MESIDLIKQIKSIISLEESGLEYDYSEIERLSLEAIRYINSAEIDVSLEIYKFLDDYDIRHKDPEYRIYQIRKIKDLICK